MKAMQPDDRRRVKLEVKKEVDSYFEQRCTDLDVIVLFILHTVFGFGKVRLRRYFEGYLTVVRKLQDIYGGSYIYKMKEVLKKIGVDIEAWEREIKI